jgi:hypothetical protein
MAQWWKYALSTDKQFLSDSYLLTYSPYWMKNMSFNSQKPDLYDYEKITFIHRVINAQWHAKFGFRFLWDTMYMRQCMRNDTND